MADSTSPFYLSGIFRPPLTDKYYGATWHDQSLLEVNINTGQSRVILQISGCQGNPSGDEAFSEREKRFLREAYIYYNSTLEAANQRLSLPVCRYFDWFTWIRPGVLLMETRNIISYYQQLSAGYSELSFLNTVSGEETLLFRADYHQTFPAIADDQDCLHSEFRASTRVNPIYSQIAVVLSKGTPYCTYAHTYVLDYSAQPEMIAETPYAGAVWSPDGNSLAYMRVERLYSYVSYYVMRVNEISSPYLIYEGIPPLSQYFPAGIRWIDNETVAYSRIKYPQDNIDDPPENVLYSIINNTEQLADNSEEEDYPSPENQTISSLEEPDFSEFIPEGHRLVLVLAEKQEQ